MPHNHPNRLEFLSVDCVILGYENKEIKVLLYKRDENLEPHPREWALPGGFVQKEEPLIKAAKRILVERTGIADKSIQWEQLQAFDEPRRYPNKRVITIAFLAFLNPGLYTLKPGPDSLEAKWASITEDLKSLPFDHFAIIKKAFAELKQRARRHPVGAELLPPKFTLLELKEFYEAILEIRLPKNNFRRKILSMDILEESDFIPKKVPYRPPQYYSFNSQKYTELLTKGFSFDLKFRSRVPTFSYKRTR